MEYSSEMCLMEELLLVKDMEYYNYPNDVEDFDSLDTFLATNKNNIISSSINAHCSFEDYFPIDTLQTFNYDEQQYSNIYLNNSTTGGLLDGFQRPSVVADEPLPVSNESKNETKKVNGQPSKNLMAERRRRKRLNDRLSMLRSVVPKISKMDRTSILGDTIDYMKELREKINNLQEEMEIEGGGVMRVFKDANKPKEILAPKMEVERGDGGETRIKMWCAMKPGLLLSTISRVEELGLDIQQCVISCFTDFTMQASCSQPSTTQHERDDAEDIKPVFVEPDRTGRSDRSDLEPVTKPVRSTY